MLTDDFHILEHLLVISFLSFRVIFPVVFWKDSLFLWPLFCKRTIVAIIILGEITDVSGVTP